MTDYNNYVHQEECPELGSAGYTPNMCVAEDIAEQQDPKQQRVAQMFVNGSDVEYTPPQE